MGENAIESLVARHRDEPFPPAHAIQTRCTNLNMYDGERWYPLPPDLAEPVWQETRLNLGRRESRWASILLRDSGTLMRGVLVIEVAPAVFLVRDPISKIVLTWSTYDTGMLDTLDDVKDHLKRCNWYVDVDRWAERGGGTMLAFFVLLQQECLDIPDWVSRATGCVYDVEKIRRRLANIALDPRHEALPQTPENDTVDLT